MGKDFIFKQQMFNTVSSAFRSALVIGFMSSFHGLLFSQSVHESLRKGDRQYDLDNYKAAEKEYRIAADLKVNNPKALYNLGNTLYQQGNWEDAAQRFAQAASNSNNKIDQANALHNLGNSLLKQRKFKEAVSAFESSLRLRPGDPDSKTNLQMAKKKLREEDQQKKEQQQKQQNNQDNKQDPNQPNGQQPPQNQPDKQPQQPKERNSPAKRTTSAKPARTRAATTTTGTTSTPTG